MREHTSNSFSNDSVHSLSHSILLWILRNCLLQLDIMFLAVLLKRTLVFTTIISSNTFHLSTSFSFNSSMEIFKDIKHLIFGF
jgi:hypothetical protein